MRATSTSPTCTRAHARSGAHPADRARSGPKKTSPRTPTIIDFGISPDGTQVAFTTRRTQFALGSPAFVSATGGRARLSELFDVDLGNDTLTRVTHGYEGGASEQPHSETAGEDPSTGTDGRRAVALLLERRRAGRVLLDCDQPRLRRRQHAPATRAGSARRQRRVPRRRSCLAPEPTPQYISPAPPNPVATPAVDARASRAASRRDGSVLLYVRCPGAGTLRARASAPCRVRATLRRRARQGEGARRRARVARTRGERATARGHRRGTGRSPCPAARCRATARSPNARRICGGRDPRLHRVGSSDASPAIAVVFRCVRTPIGAGARARPHAATAPPARCRR